jgi:hypothetical protein
VPAQVDVLDNEEHVEILLDSWALLKRGADVEFGHPDRS